MAEMVASTYELLEKLGSGGGGVVYLAYHVRLGKKVVLKADKRKIGTSTELLRKEVDILKELKHPHIPRVYDFFVEDGIVYTAMEYLEGESLDKPLKRGEKYPQPQVILWAVQLLDALDYLHRPIHGDPPKGYVHSDVKPANLMRMPDNNIALIDFNIALALGETRVIGASAGYASPEHYGRDFSFSSGTSQDTDTVTTTEVSDGQDVTEAMGNDGKERPTEAMSDLRVQSSGRKVIVPDVRSDIYSVGATLYHLLSGRRPAREATDVEPLSKKAFSPLLVDIIAKAMDPNPDLRYQTAKEMQEAFLQLRQNDPRTKKWKKKRRAASVCYPILLAAGVAVSFVGLKRMQVAESWLKYTEYAKNALETGDVGQARKDIQQALTAANGGLLEPRIRSETRRVMADVLGVYDLSDGYKQDGVFTLPSELLGVELSPEGKTGACLYSGGLALVDTARKEILEHLQTNGSGLAEAKYLDEQTLLFAGKDGLQCYDIAERKVLWTGEPATKLCVSADASAAAAVYKDETCARVYDTRSGELLATVDFGGKFQRVAVNDSFGNPGLNLLALSRDGTFLAASFRDGSLQLFDVRDAENSYTLTEADAGYIRFSGGFYEQYFAFSATSDAESVVAVIDMGTMEQTGGFRSENSTYNLLADASGIYIQSDNIFEQLDPETGEERALVTTADPILAFATTGENSVITTRESILFFDGLANQMAQYKNQNTTHYLAIREPVALVGSLDSPTVRVLKMEKHAEAQVLDYGPYYEHDEARVSADGQTVMLFRYEGFRIYRFSGELVAEVELPEKEQIYDQQFVSEGADSRLEVTYYDGTVHCYSAADGTLLEEREIEEPDKAIKDVFEVGAYRVESDLHGTVAIFRKEDGELLREMAQDAYLTYLTQEGGYFVAQYQTADGGQYGQLYDENWEIVADLPNLCGVANGEFYFDYPAKGYMRKTHLYELEELKKLL